MTLLALVAIIFFGFATYNLTCAFVDIPTKKTSRMMMLARKQQGVKAEKLLDVYITKIAGLIAPYLKLDKLKRNKLQRALDIAGLELTPEIYTTRAWVTAGAVGLCSRKGISESITTSPILSFINSPARIIVLNKTERIITSRHPVLILGGAFNRSFTVSGSSMTGRMFFSTFRNGTAAIFICICCKLMSFAEA